MAARAAVRGLSIEEQQTIREAVAAGRRPKVVFTAAAGQVAGQVGQVVRVTDPDRSEEWMVVRFGKDELPFSPADLAVAPKSAPARRGPAGSSGAGLSQAPVPEPRAPRPVVPEAPAGWGSVAPPATAEVPVAAAGGDAGPAPARVVRRAGGKAVRAKGPAALTVTLAYADGEWTVAASQGSKALAKPYVITPAEALRMVGLLDVAAVQEAVEQVVAAERAQAEQQAERLRAELAEVEARLAELRSAD